ncbi:MAG: glycosyltransferase family 87 protein [Planctomycetota bacterium]
MSNRPSIAIVVAPFALVALILLQSPNFDTRDVQRAAPLGSDYLQEYVGSYIFTSQQANRLYDKEHSLAVQHDVEVVGFTFPESDYYPMVYPPFYYLLLSPLTCFSYPVAMRLWMIGLGLCIAGFAWLMTRYFPPLEKYRSLTLVAILGFAPMFVSLTMAHKSVILLLILGGTFLLLHREKPLTAGLVFGLIAFKPHIAIPIGVAMLCKRQWRFVAGAVATVSILVALCFVRGPKPCIDYFWQCAGMGDYVHTGGYKLAEAHGISGVVRLMIDESAHPGVVNSLTTGLTIIVLSMLVLGLRGPMDTKSTRFGLKFSMLVVATALLSPHFYYYDLTILLLPILLLGTMATGNASSGDWGQTLSHGQRRGLLILTVSLFLTASFFTQLAQLTGIQLSLFLLLALLGWSLKCLMQTEHGFSGRQLERQIPPGNGRAISA